MTNTQEKLRLGQIEPIPFSHLTGKPTTLSGYGITDAYTRAQMDARYVRFDGVQTLTEPQKSQARANIGAISSAGVTSLTKGTGISFSTGTTLSSTGTVSFDTVWGDARYIRFVDTINLSATWLHQGNVAGIDIASWTSGSSNYPTSLGAGLFVHINSNNSSSSFGRMFGLIRNYDSESYYLGSPRANGVRNPWRLIYHSGNFNPASYQLALGFTPENVANKVISMTTIDDTRYPSIKLVNDNFVRLSTDQSITGLKSIRRGSNAGEVNVFNFDYPDNNGTDYNLRLYNNGSGNNVSYYFKQKLILGTNSVSSDLAVLGFRNWVTLIGTNAFSAGLEGEIATYYNAQTNPATRYPLSLYCSGESMFTGRVFAGINTYGDKTYLDNNDYLYSEGRVYALEGFRTKNPSGIEKDWTTWLLGNVITDSSGSHNRKVRISVDGVEIDLFGAAVVV